MQFFPAPSRRNIITLVLTLWQIVSTAIQTFVLGSLREGAIDVRPLSRTLRVVVIVGLTIIIGFLFGILFSDSLRVSGPLEFLANESSSTRALHAPSIAFPITLVALTLGWGYMLAGALHAHRIIRWFVCIIFIVYMLFANIVPLTQPFDTILWPFVFIVLLLLAFIILPRVHLPLPLEWSFILLICGAMMIMSVYGNLIMQRLSGENWTATTLTTIILNQFMLITPFLLLSGLGWVDFALDASGWAASAVRRHAGSGLSIVILLAILIFRSYEHLSKLFATALSEQAAALGGAALLIIGIVAILLWRIRQAAEGNLDRRIIVFLVLMNILIQIILLLSQALLTLPALVFVSPESERTVDRISAVVVMISNLEPKFRPWIFVMLGLGLYLLGRRRQNPSLAAFGLVIAWFHCLRGLMMTDRVLESLSYRYEQVDILATLLLTVLALFWLIRRRLSPERTIRLLVIALLLALLNQTDFLDNPFSPLFSFAGVAFLIFGIIWNILMAGSFANLSSPGLPRESRLLLYIGYVLISVAITHWYLVSHNIGKQLTTSTINELGFLSIGLPLAYLAIAEGGKTLVRESL